MSAPNDPGHVTARVCRAIEWCALVALALFAALSFVDWS